MELQKTTALWGIPFGFPGVPFGLSWISGKRVPALPGEGVRVPGYRVSPCVWCHVKRLRPWLPCRGFFLVVKNSAQHDLPRFAFAAFSLRLHIANLKNFVHLFLRPRPGPVIPVGEEEHRGACARLTSKPGAVLPSRGRLLGRS